MTGNVGVDTASLILLRDVLRAVFEDKDNKIVIGIGVIPKEIVINRLDRSPFVIRKGDWVHYPIHSIPLTKTGFNTRNGKGTPMRSYNFATIGDHDSGSSIWVRPNSQPRIDNPTEIIVERINVRSRYGKE